MMLFQESRKPAWSNVFSCHCYIELRVLHSFPTRRSSDLVCFEQLAGRKCLHLERFRLQSPPTWRSAKERKDRKSTRLNSSHRTISYAVFCLKKKRRDVACREEL